MWDLVADPFDAVQHFLQERLRRWGNLDEGDNALRITHGPNAS
jgi:hypothetical protein